MSQAESTFRIEILALVIIPVVLSAGCQKDKSAIEDVPVILSECRVLCGHEMPVQDVAYSSDGRFIASSGGMDATVRVWNAQTGELLHVLNMQTDFVYGISISPDSRLLACGTQEGVVKIWDIVSGKERGSLLLPCSGSGRAPVFDVDFSPHGDRIAATYLDGYVYIYDVDKGKEVLRIGPREGGVDRVQYAPSGDTILSTRGRDVFLWNAADGQEICRFENHNDATWAVVFLHNEYSFASGSLDGTIWLHNCGDLKQDRLFAKVGSWVSALAVSPDETLIASSSAQPQLYREDDTPIPIDPDIRLWDITSGREFFRCSGHSEGVSSLAFSPDGHYLVSGSFDKTVRVWPVPESAREKARHQAR